MSEPWVAYRRGEPGLELDEAVRAVEDRAGMARCEGVAMSGCVEAIGTGREGAMRRSAHAHTALVDPFRGWVCFKSGHLSRARSQSGRPSRLLIHELAHVLTYAGHDARWRRMVTLLGAPSEAKGESR